MAPPKKTTKKSAPKSSHTPSTSSGAPPTAPKSAQTGSPALRFSPYPDLTMAIAMLRVHTKHASPQKAELLDKWLKMLNKVQSEMTNLSKLESLAKSLQKPSK